jgi:hypothetical protein
MSLSRKRSSTNDEVSVSKKKRLSGKGVSFYIPIHKLDINCESSSISCPSISCPSISSFSEEKVYTQKEVTELIEREKEKFKAILEEKLREQFNMFNQIYIENIFKEYKSTDLSYIN